MCGVPKKKNFNIQNNLFYDNSASTNGGAVFLLFTNDFDDGIEINFGNNSLTRNIAASGGGLSIKVTGRGLNQPDTLVSKYSIQVNSNYKNFIVFTENPDHIKYILKMGFNKITRNDKECYIKEI